MAVLFAYVTSCSVLMIKGVYKMAWGKLVFKKINVYLVRTFTMKL